ncbi:MAG: hypothetical protein K2Q26_05245 [Bdellovibrionales bacterium]|nr:hypothetical protein [Bdellovibrionales bacterium]
MNMILALLLSLSIASAKQKADRVYTPRAGETSIQAILRKCVETEQARILKEKLHKESAVGAADICRCITDNLQKNVPEEQLYIIAKYEAGFRVIDDIRRIEGAQVLFDFDEGVRTNCRKDVNHVAQIEDANETPGNDRRPNSKKK